MEVSGEEIIVRGVLKRVTFRNPSNGYSVIKVASNGSEEMLTVVGQCREMHTGAHIIARGSYRRHPKFGLQLDAVSIDEDMPSTPETLEKYLSSGLIKGVGPKTAEAIIDALGEDALETIYRNPKAIAAIPGVGRKKAGLIHAAFAEKNEEKEVIRFLVEHDISNGLAQRIFERYKGKTIEILSRDPYLLIRHMKGIGFATADSIAMKMGLKVDSPQRLKAGLHYALERASEDGHCYVPEEGLFEQARMLLGIDASNDLSSELLELIDDGSVVRLEDRYSLKSIARAEDFVARFIASRAVQEGSWKFSAHRVDRALRAAEAELGIEFSAEQREAVCSAASNSFMCITGGPGCGKTTIIKAITMLFDQEGKKVLLAAPTGRAAQRMSQFCDMGASTIHRLLQYDPQTGGFVHGIDDPLFGDLLIVDEASMIDLMLAKDLLSAIPAGATLVLVGDKDQLPSVGAGRVFGDILAVPSVHTVSLSRLFRRSEASTINSIAHMVNSGVVPDIPEPDGVTKVDAYFIPRNTAEEAAKTVEKLVSDQIPKKFGFSPLDITVLTPSNRGPLGTIALNKQLQDCLNPAGSVDPEQELELENGNFRIGDRVCQRVNNYQIDAYGVFNGDTGIIHEVNKKEQSLVVELWDGRLVKYERTDLHQLSHAYAISVHRSQGSEVPCVVLALDKAHYNLLERQLIYTGITRAKKLLIITGQRQAFAMACKRAMAKRRCTQLREKIERLIS